MKKQLIPFLCSILVVQQVVGIERSAEQVLNSRENKNLRYVFKKDSSKSIIYEMKFGDCKGIKKIDLDLLNKVEVYQIDLVYTDFPKDSDLKSLNIKRVQWLENIKKELITNLKIEWKIIRQIGCKSQDEAKNYFHGFVLHTKSGNGKHAQGVKTITEVMNRKSWNEPALIMDVTHSMSPYIGQVLLWYKLYAVEKNIKGVTMFNDGNGRPTVEKKIGAAGGIYAYEGTDFKEFEKVIIMANINCGDNQEWEENDYEGVLHAIKKYPNAKEYILIADNLSPVRDHVLITKINRPIHVILCGVYDFVNIEYLNLAYKTGGSVHTIEEDLEDIFLKKEGEMFDFQDQLYIIINGQIRLVKET